jgi:aminobenzoyl-glutamate utilization protein B
MPKRTLLVVLAFTSLVIAGPVDSAKEKAMKADLAGQVESMRGQVQVMIDTIFSFAELGFQEYETSKYLTGMLEAEGFKVEHGIAGIPSAWMATWGSGKPVIALGSDIDCIPQASQKPGVAYHDPLIEGAPGHAKVTIPGKP